MAAGKRKWAVCLLDIVLPLLLGGCLYILFRHDSWIAHMIWQMFHLRFKLPQNVLTEVSVICTFLRNYAGDMLWAYALFATVAWIEKEVPERILLKCVLFETVLECLQKCGIIAGTFDICDILAETVATFVAYCLLGKRKDLWEDKETMEE